MGEIISGEIISRGLGGIYYRNGKSTEVILSALPVNDEARFSVTVNNCAINISLHTQATCIDSAVPLTPSLLGHIDFTGCLLHRTMTLNQPYALTIMWPGVPEMGK